MLGKSITDFLESQAAVSLVKHGPFSQPGSKIPGSQNLLVEGNKNVLKPGPYMVLVALADQQASSRNHWVGGGVAKGVFLFAPLSQPSQTP